MMLYTDARNFLLSTLRKGEAGKHVIRAMFDLIRCDFQHLSRLSLSAMLHMTDLNIILTLWRLQIEQAEEACRNFAPKNLMASLYGENLVNNPLETLLAVNQFMGLEIPAEHIESMVNSDRRYDDAKVSGQRFSVQKRQETYQQLESFYGTDLDNGLNWMLKNNPDARLHPQLTAPLIIRSK